jgi:hypothetical protein
MVIGDDELDAGRTTLTQTEKEFAPVRSGLALGQLEQLAGSTSPV